MAVAWPLHGRSIADQVRGLGPAAFQQCLVVLRDAHEEPRGGAAEWEMEEGDAGGEAADDGGGGEEMEQVRVGVGRAATIVTVPRTPSWSVPPTPAFQGEQMRAALVSRRHETHAAHALTGAADAWERKARVLRRNLRAMLSTRAAAWVVDGLIVANVIVLLVEVELGARGESAALQVAVWCNGLV